MSDPKSIADRVIRYYRRIPLADLARVRADWGDRSHWRARPGICRHCANPHPTNLADDEGRPCHKVCHEIASYLTLEDRLPLLALETKETDG